MTPKTVAALLLLISTAPAWAEGDVGAGEGEVIEIHDTAPAETKPVSYELDVDEIRAVPGAGNDVLRAATVLPGVARIPYSFGGLVLRGASPRDTAVYLDGIEVPIAFHFGGVTAFYPSAMLNDLVVTSGGFDASMGHAQGGVVTLATRDPRTDRYRIGGSIGLLDSSVQAEGPVAGGGFLLGVRRSYLDTIVSPLVADNTALPSYWDAQLRTSWGDPRRSGRITPMIFGAIDRVASTEMSLTSAFIRAGAPYTRQWGPTTLRVVPWLGVNGTSLWERATYATVDDPMEREHEHRFARPVYVGGVRSELVRDFAWGHLRGGLELDGGKLGVSSASSDAGAGDYDVFGKSPIGWTNFAAFAEARYQLAHDRISIKPGLRVERYGLTREVVVDPRLNLAERITDRVQLRQAIGRYHQAPTPSDADRMFGNPDLKSSYADQLSLGVDALLPESILGSVTGFYTRARRIGVPTRDLDGDGPPESIGGLDATFELLLEKQLGFARYRENIGRGRSYGVELSLRRNVGPWFALLSYTLAKSERTDDPRLGLGWRPFELDQRHDLQIAVSRQLAKWRFGARVQLVSGNPYSPERSFTYTDENGVEVYDREVKPWAGRLPMFFSLDLRVDRTWKRSWGDVSWFLDVQNATWHHNVEAREPNPDPLMGGDEVDVGGLPILPFTGVEFRPRD